MLTSSKKLNKYLEISSPHLRGLEFETKRQGSPKSTLVQ